MSDPWFDPSSFGAWYGSIAGGLGGTLCGCFGGLIGYLAPKGKGRRLAMTGAIVFLVIGITNLAIGVVALVSDQPYAIWYPFLLIGVILTAVMASLLPVIRTRYAQAEQRKIEAEGIRQA